MTKKFNESEEKTISKKHKKICFDRFCGVDTVNERHLPEGSAEIVNFRILPDGSLQKREGFRKLCSLDKKIRALWSGRLSAENALFVLAGTELFKIGENGEALSVALVSDTDKNTDFFYYRNTLYLLDGEKILSVTENGTEIPKGYAPLVGKDWSDNKIGDVYEQRNVLTNKARISYVISPSPSSILKTGAPISSVEAIYINGIQVSSENYIIGADTTSITVKGMDAGDKVTAYFTYVAEDNFSAELKKSTRATVFGGINDSRPLLWNGNNGSLMYCAGYVSDNSLAESRKGHPDSDALYFPADGSFSVGDGRFPITGVGRHFGRLIVFTEGGAWMAESIPDKTETFPIMRINSTVGIRSHGATAMLGNDPVTVGADCIYRWSADTDELDECNAHPISHPINALVKESFFGNGGVFFNDLQQELLLYSPDAYGTVWVYSQNGWYRFEGIYADGFFKTGEKLGFYLNKEIYLFDASLTEDEGGKEISAYFMSNLSELSNLSDCPLPFKKKLSSIEMSSVCGDIEAQIFLDGESVPSVTTRFTPTDTGASVRKRISAKRFDTLQVKIIASGENRQKICYSCIIIR